MYFNPKRLVMRMWYALALGAACFLGSAADVTPADPLVGVWVVMSTRNGGSDDDQLVNDTATFAGGRVTFKNGEGREHAAAYTLDLDKTPAAIDLVPADGPHQGNTLKGIFAIQKGDLRICVGKEREDRPAAFSSNAGERTVLFVLRRADTEASAAPVPSAAQVKTVKPPPRPWASRADEARAEVLSLSKGAESLAAATQAWIETQKCASCHTGLPCVLARSSLADPSAPGLLRVRAFLEDRVAAWDEKGKGTGYLQGEGTVRETEGITEVVAIAATLAIDDALSSGKLHPRTRQALDRIWELQRPDGSWSWNKTALAPLEYDDYFGAVYAALGVGLAPEDYANSAAAQEGVARLKRYLQQKPPPNRHHKIWLLWASQHLDGLMTPAACRQTIDEIIALQRPDGGWNLPSLGDWKRRDGSANDPQTPSDGYATGLVVYVLRQAGVTAHHEALQRGVHWLETNQRASGRWFTRSLNHEHGNVLSNAGTAFALMALKACRVAAPERP